MGLMMLHWNVVKWLQCVYDGSAVKSAGATARVENNDPLKWTVFDAED